VSRFLTAHQHIIGYFSALQWPTARSNALPVETQVLAALQFYATGSFQWMVGRSCRVSQSSVSLAIDSVTHSLMKLAPNFITFPTDRPTILRQKLAFNAVAGFPNVVGAIDGTHIAIKSPSINEEAFVNRKGVHTINVQAVCDSEMKITNLVAKWPGSTHDSFIWRTSGLYTAFQRGDVQDSWLIGEKRLLNLLHYELSVCSILTNHLFLCGQKTMTLTAAEIMLSCYQ